MRWVGVSLLAGAIALPVAGQAVSSWSSASGVPLAVLETPGGDLEHVAAVVSPASVAPADVMGYTLAASPTRGAQVWVVTVPELLAAPAIQQLVAAASAGGAAALVAVGPVPARELRGVLAALDAVPRVILPRPVCVLADGGETVERGDPERVELRFAAFPPADPRSVFLPALAAWVRLRLAASFAALDAAGELRAGCGDLLITAPTGDGEPHDLLRRLRAALGSLAHEPATGEEARTITALLQRRGSTWAADGAALARDLAARSAEGADVALAVGTQQIDAAAIQAAFEAVVAGRAGAARVFEAEPRMAPPRREPLDNGVLVEWRFIPGGTAAIAVAFGSLDPTAGRDLGRTVASRAAARGWTAVMTDVLGVPGVAVAAPAEDAVAVLERAAEAIAAWRPGSVGPDDEARALAFASRPTGEGLSVALALPLTAETAPEGAAKFFGALPAGRIAAGTVTAGGMLSLTPEAGPARITATVPVPPGAAGLIATEVLAARAAGAGLEARYLAPAGGVVLALDGSADRDVPSFDAALAATWKTLVAPVDAEGTRAAARRLAGRLYGDLLQSVARTAAAAFLPAIPTQVALLGTEAKEVSAALAGLPAWTALHRLARGPVPAVELPRGDVRKSPARPPGRP